MVPILSRFDGLLCPYAERSGGRRHSPGCRATRARSIAAAGEAYGGTPDPLSALCRIDLFRHTRNHGR